MLLGCGSLAFAGQGPAGRQRIAGRVTSAEGAPFAGALITILRVGPLAGPNLDNPWCYPDCGKHAVSNTEGWFEISGMEDPWAFTVRVEGKGHFPEFFAASLIAGEPFNIRLDEPRSAPERSYHSVTAQALQPDGRPAAGMHVAVIDAKFRGLSDVGEQLDLTATTDAEGRFTLFSEQPLAELTVTLDASEPLNQRPFHLKPLKQANILQLLEGTTVTGRVLKMTKPVEGVTVGIVGLTPTYGEFSGTYEAKTDRDGRFAIQSVFPERDFYLFTRMNSLRGENLAAIKQMVRSWGDGQTTEIAELNLHPSHRVRGRLVFSDGTPVPPDIRVALSRAGIFDSQETVADRDGRFLFEGVPSESVVLSFHSPGKNFVPGYRLSPQHFNLDYLRRTALCGRVDDDLDLVVLFEPGETSPADDGPRPFAAGTPVRPDDPLFVKQKRLEAEPLRGIPTDVLARAQK
jgi:hypothetical protein